MKLWIWAYTIFSGGLRADIEVYRIDNISFVDECPHSFHVILDNYKNNKSSENIWLWDP